MSAIPAWSLSSEASLFACPSYETASGLKFAQVGWFFSAEAYLGLTAVRAETKEN
jgi:hypothetical protein